ncbi:fibronectin type III domain-containing protein [Niastella sp. OAS944]|uniref:fibronectin type III domain-containing protein n=1 Tax=Niastella sp. OAS944 TaxID=2664089 RepID=UPI00348104DE
MGEIKADLPAFITSITKASGGDEEFLSAKKDFRTNMLIKLGILAEYVTLTCGGDRTKLLSSGFELNRARGEKSLAAIKELKVTAERTGEANTRVKKVAGAKAYIHQYTPDPLMEDSVWVSKFVTDSRYTFTGLKSKEKYLFQVIAIGMNGQETVSPAVARVIQ